MAKDTRSRKTPTRRKKSKAKLILAISLAVFVVLVGVFIMVMISMINNTTQIKDQHESLVNKLNITPEALQDKVAYYVFGVLGEDMENDPMAHLSIVCYDKTKKTLNILEVPQDTYLGTDAQWVVDKTGQLWANPAPKPWCDTEQKQIPADSVKTCREAGHQVSEKEGSSVYDVGSVFNKLSLPVDGYFYFSQDAFVDLVDNLGGIDVELEKAQTLGEIEYRDGIRTLDGAGALEYALKLETKGVAGDLDRLVRQRKVFLAVFQRLAAQTEEELTTQSIGNVMGGSSRVFFGLYNTETTKYDKASTAQTVTLIRTLSAIKPSSITAQLLPGQAATHESTTYYSIHRAALVELLNTDFHMYDNKATEADIQIVELASDEETDTRKQVLSEIAVTQTGLNEPAADDADTTEPADDTEE